MTGKPKGPAISDGRRKSPNLISWLEHGSGWIEAKEIFAHGLIVRFASLDLLRNDVSVLKSTLDSCGSENCAGATEIVSKAVSYTHLTLPTKA